MVSDRLSWLFEGYNPELYALMRDQFKMARTLQLSEVYYPVCEMRIREALEEQARLSVLLRDVHRARRANAIRVITGLKP